MDSFAQQLSAQADKHPDELMGVAFCHDYSAIELSVKDGVNLKQLPDVAEILSDDPASRVVIQTTPMSVAELRALRDSVVEADLADGTASAASYAIGTHHSTVVGSSQRGAQDTSLKKLKNVGHPGRVKIRDEKSKGHGTDSPLTDVPALNPGAEITHQDGDWLWFCSLGVPVKVGGVSMILTAGPAPTAVTTLTGAAPTTVSGLFTLRLGGIAIYTATGSWIVNGPDESFILDPFDTVASVLSAYQTTLAQSRAAVAGLALSDELPGSWRGPLPLGWVHPHLLRELGQHCGHEILREQIWASRTSS